MPRSYTFRSPTHMSRPTRAPGMTSCMRLMHRMNVDFPQPDGPIRAVTLFGFISRLTSRTASFLLYQADTSSDLTASPIAFFLPGAHPIAEPERQHPSGEVQDDDDAEENKGAGPRLAVQIRIGRLRVVPDLHRQRPDRTVERVGERAAAQHGEVE